MLVSFLFSVMDIASGGHGADPGDEPGTSADTKGLHDMLGQKQWQSEACWHGMS